MKKCTKCKICKEEDEFFFRDKSKGKRHNQCKTCQKERRKLTSKVHYEKYKEDYKERAVKRNKRIYEENRLKLAQYLLDKSCKDCGNSNILVLEFDHLPEFEKKNQVTSLLQYKWETVMSEIDKCEIVCKNCHGIRTSKRANTFRWRFIQEINDKT